METASQMIELSDGVELQAVKDDSGKPFVVLKPLCDTLGLNYRAAEQKLNRQRWSTVCKIHTVGADGKNREMTCIDGRTMLMWFAGIDPEDCRPQVQAALHVYQDEAADALEQWATGGNTRSPEVLSDMCGGLPAEYTAILLDCQRRLTDMTEAQGLDIREIREVQNEHGQAIKRIENSLTSHRKPFGKQAIKAAEACLDDKYNRGGNIVCPCCERKLETFECHHWQGKGGNSASILFPLHPQCHAEAESNPKWHDDKRPEFTIWQKHARPYFRNVGLLVDKQRVEVQPTLFGDLNYTIKTE